VLHTRPWGSTTRRHRRAPRTDRRGAPATLRWRHGWCGRGGCPRFAWPLAYSGPEAVPAVRADYGLIGRRLGAGPDQVLAGRRALPGPSQLRPERPDVDQLVDAPLHRRQPAPMIVGFQTDIGTRLQGVKADRLPFLSRSMESSQVKDRTVGPASSESPCPLGAAGLTWVRPLASPETYEPAPRKGSVLPARPRAFTTPIVRGPTECKHVATRAIRVRPKNGGLRGSL
jgi:hypothetical protein